MKCVNIPEAIKLSWFVKAMLLWRGSIVTSEFEMVMELETDIELYTFVIDEIYDY